MTILLSQTAFSASHPSIRASTSSVNATVGVAITAVTIIQLGGSVDSFGISPDITVTGLSVDTATGTISGIPTAPIVVTNYTITATNVAGTNTARVTIFVGGTLPPPVIRASLDSVSATVGTAITAVTIISSGGRVASYGISPDIAVTGLSVDTATGTISGIPTAPNSRNSLYHHRHE